MCPTIEVANGLVPCIVISLLFFAGCLLRTADIPRWWHWFSYLDPLRYAYGALMVGTSEYTLDAPNTCPNAVSGSCVGCKRCLSMCPLAGLARPALQLLVIDAMIPVNFLLHLRCRSTSTAGALAGTPPWSCTT